MNNSDIKDSIFREAVEAIDSGNISVLEQLINTHPRLISEKLNNPQEGYFKDPYLLWFIADNPIRHDKLPENIVAVTRLLVDAVKKTCPRNLSKPNRLYTWAGGYRPHPARVRHANRTDGSID